MASPARSVSAPARPALPFINARFLEDDADRTATAPVLGIARELFAKAPLAAPTMAVAGIAADLILKDS